MKTILMTGVTGFVGSALAASLLARKNRVVALSRNDPHGTRTLHAVKDACSGFNIPTSTLDASLLVVRSIDFENLGEFAKDPLIAEVDEVWHVAAEMSYSNAKFVASFHQNLTVTSELHQLLNDHGPHCKRFFYVSTAFTAGFSNEVVEEKIHTDPHFVNVYQASKWATETCLYVRGHETKLPVTIFRPSIVIGHEITGWYGHKSFGMYSIVQALLQAKITGHDEVTINAARHIKNNFIPIDYVIDYALRLSERESSGEFEIYNVVASECLTSDQVLEIIGEVIGIKLNFGKPRTNFDAAFQRAAQDNLKFANTQWVFINQNLAATLGAGFIPSRVNAKILTHLIQIYAEDQERKAAVRQQALGAS